MAKKLFYTNTNSVRIAHYILLFAVAILCISIVAYAIIHRDNPTPTSNVHPSARAQYQTPCSQRTADTIAQMWAYDQKSVPQKYWDIAMNYLNQPVPTATYGICQDVAFHCRSGEIRRNCDPCAVPSARMHAMDIHIRDAIKQNCPDDTLSDQIMK